MDSYRDLTAWKMAHTLCIETFRATGGTDDRKWSVLVELRRAALRVPTNIAKASAFRSERRFGRYVGVALAFAFETQYLLGLAAELECISGLKIAPLRQCVNAAIHEIFQLLQQARSED